MTNEVGESIWSDPLKVSTAAENDETTTTEAPDAESEVAAEESMTETTFYGIFFFGGVFVVAFVCVFVMRLIK